MANYSAQIEQLLGSAAITTSLGAKRVPFVMGSLHRQIQRGIQTRESLEQIEASLRANLSALFKQGNRLLASSLREGADIYDSMINTSGTNMARDALKDSDIVPNIAAAITEDALSGQMLLQPVTMLVNPSDLTIAQPKRKVGVPTQAGTRWLHFLDATNRNNDIMRITIGGTTGSMHVSPDTPRDAPERAQALARYRAWLSFYALVNEPMLTTAKDGTLMPNEFSLVCPSPHLSVPLAFIGHWDAMPEVKVTSADSHSLTYSATFIVNNTNPSISSALSRAASNDIRNY